MRTEFPNLAIVSITLKNFCKPFLNELEAYYDTPEEKLNAVRNSACDSNEQEIVAMCDYIERQNLTKTFFPA